MRTLPHPGIDEEALYTRLQERRQSNASKLLLNAKQQVFAAYSKYKAEELPILETVIDDQDTAEHLRSNYKVLRSGALGAEGAEILARSRICCLCGLRNTAELDHYLPKQIFPEFAAHTVNLVPACGVCNKRKGEAYKTSAGTLAFIHAYLDELPATEPFLVATLGFDRAVLPSYRIIRTLGMTNDMFCILTSQFNHFELDKFYSEEAIELLIEKYFAIEEYFTDGGSTAVKKYLHREAQSLTGRWGQNHWKPVILAAAAESEEFCGGKFKLLAPHP